VLPHDPSLVDQATTDKPRDTQGSIKDDSVRHSTTLEPLHHPVAMTSSSQLLELAAELRNEIYSYVLNGQHDTKVSAYGDDYHPALLRTCKQIRNEALPIWYATTTFIFQVTSEHTSGPMIWLDRIHRDDQKRIRKMAVEWQPSAPERRIIKAIGPRSSIFQLDSYSQKMFSRGRNAVQCLAPFVKAMRQHSFEKKNVVCRALAGEENFGARMLLSMKYSEEVELLLDNIYST